MTISSCCKTTAGYVHVFFTFDDCLVFFKGINQVSVEACRIEHFNCNGLVPVALNILPLH